MMHWVPTFLLAISIGATTAGCTRRQPASQRGTDRASRVSDPVPTSSSAAESATPAAPTQVSAHPAVATNEQGAAPEGSATPSASASTTPPEAVPPIDPTNKITPSNSSDDLTDRSRHLFDAVVRDDPAIADDFFFPREPFIPLKDAADAGRYFDQLLATYHRDVHKLHVERKSWDGATFASFELGTTPRWVKPGEEWNKIGYFRTFHGKLTYEIDGKKRTIDVHTIISWQGKWYVTHLLPFKH